jgi:hypothetical protein
MVMSEILPLPPSSIEPPPSLAQIRSRHREELQDIFRHESDRVPHAVLITEEDLVLACALRIYPPHTASLIRAELERQRKKRPDQARDLSLEQRTALKESVTQILMRPDFLNTYTSLARGMKKALEERQRLISVRDLSQPHSDASSTPTL